MPGQPWSLPGRRSSLIGALTPASKGALARGTATFTASDSATVLFAPPFAANTYVVKLTPSLDNDTDELPVVGYANKTTTGFEIKLSDAFTGTVDWEAAL